MFHVSCRLLAICHRAQFLHSLRPEAAAGSAVSAMVRYRRNRDRDTILRQIGPFGGDLRRHFHQGVLMV
jgi:hypothetical protein